MLTGDLNMVLVNWEVRYKIKDVDAFISEQQVTPKEAVDDIGKPQKTWTLKSLNGGQRRKVMLFKKQEEELVSYRKEAVCLGEWDEQLENQLRKDKAKETHELMEHKQAQYEAPYEEDEVIAFAKTAYSKKMVVDNLGDGEVLVDVPALHPLAALARAEEGAEIGVERGEAEGGRLVARHQPRGRALHLLGLPRRRLVQGSRVAHRPLSVVAPGR